MPRFRRRQRQPRAPKPPKPAKLPRPKTKDLRMVLKGLMTVSQSNRIASLAYAMKWYDDAVLYLVSRTQLDAATQKALHRATACRKQGLGTTNDHEKETSFLTAVRQYEKACVSLRPPLVDKFYDAFNAKRAVLEAKQQRLQGKFGSVISLLQKSIGNRVKLQIADAAKPFQYDPGLTSVTYNREAAKALAMKFRQEGILAVLVDQMDILAQHVALESDGKGGWQYDPARHVTIVGEMLVSFVQFAKSADAPNRLVRNFVPAQPRVQQPGQPAGPRPPRVSVGGPKVAGRYTPGTSMALLYEKLQDGSAQSVTEILKGLPAANPMSRFKDLVKDGVRFGTWTISVNGDIAQMIMAQPAAKP